MNQEKLEEQINSGPLYSFVGYLLDMAKLEKTLHLILTDPANNVIIDDDIIDTDNLDSIILKKEGKIECSRITRDVCYGYKLEIKII